ncbi:MAG: sulfatase-like hydrolase/transferase [Candidatus Marinimicrobia bacterium]|nr:sulfatase-like hydrolase/transferase [Candidatus Neomarinimicrobiota bacterium]
MKNETAAGKRKPNILLIMTDQHRFDCLGCHGHPLVKTPHIDRLAAAGVDFQRCYAQSAICMPSRLTALTGQYLHTHGIQHNSRQVDVSHLTTLPQVLKQQGYQTAAVGKTHVGRSDEVGFDYARICAGAVVGETNQYNQYLADLGLSEPDRDQAMKAYDAYVSAIPYEHTNEVWTANQALEFLNQRNAEQPFMLWLTFERPHAPTCVPPDNPFPYDPEAITLPPYDERFYTKPDTRRPGCENSWNVFNTGEKVLRQALANYYSLISMIDDQIGRVLGHLEETGALENTVVIFTADHGDFAGAYGQFGKNTSTFDVLYRVPFIWSWPGRTGRERSYELVELTDFMPTVLELAGIDCPASVQGRSIAPAILGSPTRGGLPWDGKDAVFFETPYVKTVRTKTHKLSLGHKGGRRSWGQLYDLARDPWELENLFDRPEHQWVQQRLERRLLEWFIETDQPQEAGAGWNETPPEWCEGAAR